MGTYLFAIAKSTNVNDLQNALKTRTLIFDREEKEAGALSGQKGTYVELTDISKDLQNAVVATEDRSFYKNAGLTRSLLPSYCHSRSFWRRFYHHPTVGEKRLSVSGPNR